MKLIALPGSDFLALDARGHDFNKEVFGCHRCIQRGDMVLLKDPQSLKDHMEAEHHTPVMIGDEGPEQAIARFRNSELADCQDCREHNAPWTRRGDGGV